MIFSSFRLRKKMIHRGGNWYFLKILKEEMWSPCKEVTANFFFFFLVQVKQEYVYWTNNTQGGAYNQRAKLTMATMRGKRKKEQGPTSNKRGLPTWSKYNRLFSSLIIVRWITRRRVALKSHPLLCEIYTVKNASIVQCQTPTIFPIKASFQTSSPWYLLAFWWIILIVLWWYFTDIISLLYCNCPVTSL